MTGPAQRNIVLVGFMGSGKSAVGRRLADDTGRTFIDTDLLVVPNGSSLDELFESEGLAGFRSRERDVVRKASRARGAVIATGGGSVLDPANVRDLKRSGVVVYLKTTASELARRLDDSNDRPLLRLNGRPARGAALRAHIAGMLAEREPVYESVADHVISSDGRNVNEVAGEIEKATAAAKMNAPRVQRVRVPLDPSYSVSVGRGLLDRVDDLVKLPKGAENAGIVSHPRIKRLWGRQLESALNRVGLRVSWYTFPEGEESKSVETAGRLSQGLARAGFHRDDVVFALGGGVTGDVAGYVASTYARGIAFVQVPTTLLAMVDAAIGGKTGVNLPQGKNLVGTFHQPLGVVADLDVLSTLPRRDLRGGLAEVIKYGFIADPPLVKTVQRERDEILAAGEVLGPLVGRCAGIKARVVAADERDQGLRAILNYGHTLGHAIESLTIERGGRARLHHGEAIAIGMVYAAAVSARIGLADVVEDHRRVLEAVGLPTRVSGLRWSAVLKRMELDKKYRDGARLVLLERVGRPVVRKVARQILKDAYAEVTA
ncbi:MAG: 3-dehydroquinate synthase [Actinomycetota bacterium]